MRWQIRPINRWLEPFFVLVIFVAIVRAGFYFAEHLHWPQPFFYEPYDTWMDWFAVATWARDKSIYDTWQPVYAPLSFVFLKFAGLNYCYVDTQGDIARRCDWLGVIFIHTICIVNVVLLWLAFRKIDRSTAIWRTLALGFGLPQLYALERGNLVIATFTCMILAYGPILKSARLRWIAAGLAINFKIYLIAGLFAQLLRRRWLWFEGAMLATVIIYLVTYMILGDGSPRQMFNILVDNTSNYQAVQFLNIWYAASYKPLISLGAGMYSMSANVIGSRNVDILLILLPGIQYATIATIMIAALMAWLRPEAVSVNRLTFLALMVAAIISEPGGYIESIFIFFVFMEPWKGPARCWAILASYILLFPFDIILDKVPPVVQESYLMKTTTFVSYYITLGPFIRPAFFISIGFAMALQTIFEVWRDIRHQGWSGRWRYRRDAVFLPGVLRPSQPRLQRSAE